MRYRLMATYRGVPYEAGVGPTDSDVVLFAACPPPEELGFEPATGHWRKQLRIDEVQALWESRPMGTFRGDRCIVLDDLGDRLHIAYLGHDAFQAEQLGYWQVDRGVYELITPREEVSEIVEERLDYPHSAGGTAPVPAVPQQSGPLPAVAHQTGPLPAVAQRTGPLPAVAHQTGPLAAVAQHTGPLPAVAQQTGPLPAVAQQTGPHPAVPQFATNRQSGEPPLPLEAAARRAASARVLQPAGPARPDTGLFGYPGPLAPTAAPSAPEPRPPAPAGAEPAPPAAERQPPARRRRSALRRQATQRIFSELASLAAIPPSAYAVGEEVDGAMCLIQTPDGFEVFNAAAGARHEVRIFDDEESAYFYLFGVLAAEAVRTGRLAPQG
jgi:hypothetical protein